MLRRPTLRAALTTVAAAAVLVGGADLASYAATGHPLLIGKANTGVGTTTLKNLGRGPALSLNSIKSAPPLVVNSGKLVRHLNANMVQGQKASQLNPAVWRFSLGKDVSKISNNQHFFTAKLPAGTYVVQMGGIVTSGTTGDGYVCAIGDKRKLVQEKLAGVYTYIVGQFNDDLPTMDDSYTVKISKGRPVLFGCNFEGDTGPVTVVKTLQFTFRQAPVVDKKGKSFTFPFRNAGSSNGVLGR